MKKTAPGPIPLKLGINARFLWDYNLRGFNRYTFCLLKELQRRQGIEIHLYTERRYPVHPRFQEMLHCQIHLLDAPRSLVWEQYVLPTVLRRDGIDIFHAPADGGLPRRKTARYVLTYHHAADKGLQHMIRNREFPGRLDDYLETDDIGGTQGRLRRWRHGLMRSLYFRAADCIITVSAFAKWQLVHLLGVPEKSVKVIYEAPDEIFAVALPLAHIDRVLMKYGVSCPYVLFVGGYDKRKNPTTLLRVFADLQRLGATECLVLTGSGGDVATAKRYAQSLGLVEGRNLLFLERVHEDLPALYQGAKLFITLSWEETFCFPLVEAMASGIPVVASCLGAIPEIIGDAGVLVDPRDTGHIVRTLRDLLASPDARRDLADRAARRAQFFSWNKAADETLVIYHELTSPDGV